MAKKTAGNIANVVKGFALMLVNFNSSPDKGKEESTGGMSFLIVPAATHAGITLDRELAVKVRRMLFRTIAAELVATNALPKGSTIPNNDDGLRVLIALPESAYETVANAAVKCVEQQAAVSTAAIPEALRKLAGV